MQYRIQSKGQLLVDGQMIDAGAIVGTLETSLELSNVISALWCGDMRAIAIEPMEARPADVRNVRRERDATSATTIEPPAADDPDTLNAIDNANDTADVAAAAAPSAVTTEIEVVDATANPFEGLAPRIADALLAAGFQSRESVAEVATDGADAFLDIDGIGKSAAKKIIEWLHL
jgi:hypothetical protein